MEEDSVPGKIPKGPEILKYILRDVQKEVTENYVYVLKVVYTHVCVWCVCVCVIKRNSGYLDFLCENFQVYQIV